MSTEIVRSTSGQPYPEEYDLAAVRRDFPILDRKIRGKRLVYLDNAATTQKPKQVLDAESRFYSSSNSNVHRGVHTLSEEATAAYEETRERVAEFLGGVDSREIIYTSGTTESINLVAHAWGRSCLGPEDEILITEMEHHSNIVPWIMISKQTGARIRHIPITGDGRLDLSDLDRLLTERTKIVAVTLISNVLGTLNPVAEISAAAHAKGALVLVDGAQGVAHGRTDVTDLGCDFLAFSSHKMLGPTGLGFLWARAEILERMEPFEGGGEMIHRVELTDASWKEIPWKFEAGTPNIAAVIAFPHALDYLTSLGLERVAAHERNLARYAIGKMRDLGHLEIYGPEERAGIVAFNDTDVHPHDLSQVLDQYGVAVRAGHHCCQPLMRRLGVAATARASFYVYNGNDDVDIMIDALIEARKYFGFQVSAT